MEQAQLFRRVQPVADPLIEGIKLRLIQFREKAGLSKTDLAAALGLSKQAVGAWEDFSSKNLPQREHILALARLYSVPPEAIEYGTQPPADPGMDEVLLEEVAVALLEESQTRKVRLSPRQLAAMLSDVYREIAACKDRGTLKLLSRSLVAYAARG